MKQWTKHNLVAGSVALSLLLGGGVLSAVAAEKTEPSSVSANPAEPMNKAAEPDKANRGEKKVPGHYLFQNAGEILGMKPEEVKAGLASGKSLVDLAEAKGISKETLIAHFIAKADARMDEAVQAGRLTAEKAAELKQKRGNASGRPSSIKAFPSLRGSIMASGGRS
ncbi:hypothetical protein N6H14_14005 [Paenibacillus sp. CC-CFT747]|nr:hypothetical protein N6H14_14005 [Paenibacillus sp. CC-CFT747]